MNKGHLVAMLASLGAKYWPNLGWCSADRLAWFNPQHVRRICKRLFEEHGVTVLYVRSREYFADVDVIESDGWHYTRIIQIAQPQPEEPGCQKYLQ